MDPTGRTMLYVYDHNVLLTRTEQDAETSPAITRTTVYRYDDLDRLTRTTDPAGRSTDTTYDGEGRQETVTQPDGVVWITVYGVRNNQVYRDRLYDPVANVTVTTQTYFYDAEGRTTRITDANGTVVMLGGQYDGYGQMTRQTDPLGSYAVPRFDAAGRVTRSELYDSGDTLVQATNDRYDAVGRMTLREQGRRRLHPRHGLRLPTRPVEPPFKRCSWRARPRRPRRAWCTTPPVASSPRRNPTARR